MSAEAAPDRSLGELFGDLARETGTLVRQEVQLAETEMSAKASEASKDLATIAIGTLIAQAGLISVMAAIVLMAGTLIPLWAAALALGLVVFGGGYLLLRKGTDALKHIDVVPRATVKSLKEDVAWAKGETT